MSITWRTECVGVMITGSRRHAGLVALDLGHFSRLLLRREVLVNDADAALLRDGDGEAGFSDGVHGGGHERQVQRDVSRESGRKRSVLGQDLGERRHQQHVVEGERFSKQAHR
jgi:hypothetical protein